VTTNQSQGKYIPNNGLLVELGSRDCSCSTAHSTRTLANSRFLDAATGTTMGRTKKLNRRQKTAP